MGSVRTRDWSRDAWDLVRRQHGVVTHAQLRELGMSAGAIRHRVASGRLHRVARGVFAVGRPDLDDRGRWMAAVLACGPHTLLSHRSAAALLGVRKARQGPVEVVVPAHLPRRCPGVRVHRRSGGWAGGGGGASSSRDPDGYERYGTDPLRPGLVDEIPVTGPAVLLVDLAGCLPTGQLEAAINEADHLDLIDPEALRAAIDGLPYRPGVRRLRTLLDTASRALTTTALERSLLPLAEAAGLPLPETQAHLGGHRVDFYWAELGLVVETDSLRYHRTAFKQAADKRRDNAHAGSGLTTLRFSHGQVLHEPGYVSAELRTVARRLSSRQPAALRKRERLAVP
jgi:very-short-patch-repair endonuclease